METYIESLLGIDLNYNDQELVAKAKEEYKYPILLNIATCLYKKK